MNSEHQFEVAVYFRETGTFNEFSSLKLPTDWRNMLSAPRRVLQNHSEELYRAESEII